MDKILIERTVLGYPIRVSAEYAGKDLNVSITGGDTPHIGSMSIAWHEDSIREKTVLLPSHRDDIISREYALALSELTGASVCVTCGIHYDGVTAEGIQMIVSAAHEVLTELKKQL
ncbi:MAG: hypothetical protein ACI3VB_04470 [Oscillospiraceae bacterium]